GGLPAAGGLGGGGTGGPAGLAGGAIRTGGATGGSSSSLGNGRSSSSLGNGSPGSSKLSPGIPNRVLEGTPRPDVGGGGNGAPIGGGGGSGASSSSSKGDEPAPVGCPQRGQNGGSWTRESSIWWPQFEQWNMGLFCGFTALVVGAFAPCPPWSRLGGSDRASRVADRRRA